MSARRAIVGVAAGLALAGCAAGANYRDSVGPRFAGTVRTSTAHCRVAPEAVRVVTWNTAYARDIEGVIGALTTDPELRNADIVVLQEMDAVSTRRIAEARDLHWVYYPATWHPVSRRDFGNALLARCPIERDQKLLLPRLAWSRRTQRAAVAGTVRIGPEGIRVVALHLATPIEVGLAGQRAQAQAVLEATREWPRLVVAGDFNRPGLAGLFAKDGFVWPTRAVGPTFWAFRLDHIVARGLSPAGHGRGTSHASVSDHLPVWAELAFVE